jgi:hypothetical protein
MIRILKAMIKIPIQILKKLELVAMTMHQLKMVTTVAALVGVSKLQLMP